MSKLQPFLVFLNKRLAETAVDIFGAVEKTVLEFQEENDRIRRLLQKRPEIRRCKSDSLQFSVTEEVPPEQQHCEQEWSPSLGQEDPEPTQIKEEQEELRISQEEEQLQRPIETKDSILTPPCVKSERDREDSLHKDILPGYPTLSQLKRSKLQMFHVFLNDFFMVSVAVKISGAVEKTVVEYQEENDRLRKLLGITPEMQRCTTEEVSPEQQHCEQEWTPSLGQEDPKPTHVKEEQEELQISQEEEQLQGLEPDIIEFIFPPCVKMERDQVDPLWSLTPPQTQTEEHRDSNCRPGDLTPHKTLTYLKGLDLHCNPPESQNKQTQKQHQLSHTGEKPFSCGDCGKHFSHKGTLNRHILTHTGEKPFSCGDCGKSFRVKSSLEKHTLTHTGKKPFSCDDCGKCFSRKEYLTLHIRTHTGEKPFSCGDCGKSFYHRQTLKQHELTHTGEKLFSCVDCGKCFINRPTLNQHKLTHTGEKSFSCGDCGKSFSQKGTLKSHMLTHTGEKPFICENCGKSFSQKHHLERHILTHTGEKAFSCSHCQKCFIRKEHLTLHMRTHTGEKSFSDGNCKIQSP